MYECLNELCNENQVCISCELNISISLPGICAICLTNRPLINYKEVLYKICVECFKMVLISVS